jgi:hypothetical protein
VRGRNLRVEITSFRRCRGSCPDAGGVIAITNLGNGRRFEVRYDGTNRATIIGPRGHGTTVPLACRA